MLRIELSPEQISGRMKEELASSPISSNTVYRLIYEEGWQPLLPRKGKRYKKRG